MRALTACTARLARSPAAAAAAAAVAGAAGVGTPAVDAEHVSFAGLGVGAEAGVVL